MPLIVRGDIRTVEGNLCLYPANEIWKILNRCISSFLAFVYVICRIGEAIGRKSGMLANKRFGWVTALFFGLLFSHACTKNDDSTIILLGTESYVEDILETIPDTLQDIFEQNFGEIPQGYVPPKVEGDFVIAPKQRCYSNVATWPLNVVEPNMYLCFSNQHNSVVELDLAEATETFTDTVFVVGHEDLFTVYYQESKAMTMGDDEVVLKRGIIIKGEICDEGIRNLYFANIVMDVEGHSETALVERGQFFIYKDGDGLARKEEDGE